MIKTLGQAEGYDTSHHRLLSYVWECPRLHLSPWALSEDEVLLRSSKNSSTWDEEREYTREGVSWYTVFNFDFWLFSH